MDRPELVIGAPLIGSATYRDRVFLSDGSFPAGTVGLQGYETDAIVPGRQWRKPTASEANILSARGSFHRSWCVRIIDCNFPTVGRIRSEIENMALESFYFRSLDISCDLGALVTELFRYAHVRFVPSAFLGVFVSPPGLTTITLDHQSGKRIGLHVDSWDKILEANIAVESRLCINVGPSPRDFLFANVEIPIASSKNTRPRTVMARRFLRSNPLYPIIALRINPGEAYFAPTDYLVHDASSSCATAPDVTLTVLGLVKP
jgi:hypothetical protein